jgi:hypothetical protein
MLKIKDGREAMFCEAYDLVRLTAMTALRKLLIHWYLENLGAPGGLNANLPLKRLKSDFLTASSILNLGKESVVPV